ncbi:RDD family protein [Saccharothrix hoggarensis]|uniref:RDD family protein n=1 Tax=Saccharothrix hoggarensis TaxID=913853 RepID=A0ABW3R3F9_9PSEU
MTVPGTRRTPAEFEIAKEHAEAVVGRRLARRLDVFADGTLHVKAGEGARFLAWLVDFVVYLVGVGLGFVVVSVVHIKAQFSDETLVWLLLALMFVVPLLYGMCYGNGRALGAVLIGTQLVRAKDGSRVGGRAWWAMLLRTLLLPLLIVVLLAVAFAGGPSFGGSPGRTAIDPAATRRLHAAGIR